MLFRSGNGVTFQWDNAGSGGLNTYVNTAFSGTSVWLRLVRGGNSLTAYYSTDGSTWTSIATETLTGAQSAEDVGMFASSHDAGVQGQDVFSDFSTTNSPFTAFASTSASIVDSTNPNTSANTAAYTIDAAGAGPWSSCCQTTDQYGALYEPGAATSSSTTTVEVDSQSDTNAWAMSGIMLRNSTSGSPGSLGYAALAVTPGNGVALLWDDDSSGYLNQEVATGAGTRAPWAGPVSQASALPVRSPCTRHIPPGGRNRFSVSRVTSDSARPASGSGGHRRYRRPPSGLRTS